MSSLLYKERVAHNLCPPACKILCAVFNSGTSIAEQWFHEKEDIYIYINEKGKPGFWDSEYRIPYCIQFQYTLPLRFVWTRSHWLLIKVLFVSSSSLRIMQHIHWLIQTITVLIYVVSRQMWYVPWNRQWLLSSTILSTCCPYNSLFHSVTSEFIVN
jgi:hypothetical protein